MDRSKNNKDWKIQDVDATLVAVPHGMQIWLRTAAKDSKDTSARSDEEKREMNFKNREGKAGLEIGQLIEHVDVILEGGDRQRLKDAVEAWRTVVGHESYDAQTWKEFGTGNNRLLLLSSSEPVLSPVGSRRPLDLRNLPDGKYEMLQKHISKHDEYGVAKPVFYHKTMNIPANNRARSKREGSQFSKTFLSAGFTIPPDVAHAGSPSLRTAAFIYNFPTGMSLDNFYAFVREESEFHTSEVVIPPIRSPKHRKQLKNAIERWWMAVGVEAECMDDWQGFRRGDMYIVSEAASDPEARPGNLPFLRGGATDCEDTCSNGCGYFADDFERLYVELLKQSARVRGESAPEPCVEAWMKLAGLLQMRNSYLEHQVRELQDTNDSLAEDVHWHVDALEELEEQLREAQVERATALADVLDLKIQMACSTTGQASAHAVANDGESKYTDMTSSGSDTPSICCSDSYVHDGFVCDVTSRYAPTLAVPVTATGSLPHPPTQGFYFYPDYSGITLMTNPPQSFQWPPGTTLLEIRDNLIARYELGTEDNPHLATILEIMDQRENLGVQLPGPTREDVIWIAIPDVHDLRSMNNDVRIDAWGTFVVDTVSNGRDRPDVGNQFDEFSWGVDCAGETNTPAAIEPCSGPVSPVHTILLDEFETRHRRCYNGSGHTFSKPVAWRRERDATGEGKICQHCQNEGDDAFDLYG